MGFQNKIEKEDFLKAVQRARSLSDSTIGERLGVNRSTVWRYKKDNPEIVKEAEALLEEKTVSYLSNDKPDNEVFAQIPSVAEWIDTQQKRRVSEKVVNGRVSSLNNVCYHLRTTPDALSVDKCADLVHKMRVLSEQGKDQPYGLAYYTIRKTIRSWFMLQQGISGDFLTSKGIDATASKGVGSMAREKITKQERARFEENALTAMKKAVQESTLRDDWDYKTIEQATLELIGAAHFMYYTATRKSATFNAILNDERHSLAGEIWEIHVLDKGKKGGIHWQKRLTDDGLEKFQSYVSKRFNIPVEDIPIRLPDMDSKLFPTLGENSQTKRLETVAMKYALRLSGSKVKMPNHAWRHTFAQDWLHASDWNYELGAEIGGWTDTGTMKKCYGKMSVQAVNRGLRRAMGLPVEDVTYELRW